MVTHLHKQCLAHHHHSCQIQCRLQHPIVQRSHTFCSRLYTLVHRNHLHRQQLAVDDNLHRARHSCKLSPNLVALGLFFLLELLVHKLRYTHFYTRCNSQRHIAEQCNGIAMAQVIYQCKDQWSHQQCIESTDRFHHGSLNTFSLLYFQRYGNSCQTSSRFSRTNVIEIRNHNLALRLYLFLFLRIF